MSRKTASFSQLIGYMEQGASPEDREQGSFHNLHPAETAEIIRAFEHNARHLPKRKNGVYLYHEVISLTRSASLNAEQQKAILRAVVSDYLMQRAPDCLAYGMIHDEKAENLHCHVVISANALEQTKRHRLSKAQFDRIKKTAESRVLEKYPEMEQRVAINRKAKSKTSVKEGELKRRGGRTTQKDQLQKTLQSIFQKARSKDELSVLLNQQGLAMSFRKQYPDPRFGKADSKKHFRLGTLGLDSDYQRFVDRLERNSSPEISIKPEQGRGAETQPDRQPDTKSRAGKEREPLNPERTAPPEHGNTQQSQQSPKDKANTPPEPERSAEDLPMHDASAPKPDPEISREIPEKPQKTFGRFGTLKEWLTGDFRERQEHQRQARQAAADAERQARFDAQRQEREKASAFRRVQSSTQERARRATIAAEVEARKQAFRKSRERDQADRNRNTDSSKDNDPSG